MSQVAPATRTVGFWSAVLATAFSLAYVAGRIEGMEPIPFRRAEPSGTSP